MGTNVRAVKLRLFFVTAVFLIFSAFSTISSMAGEIRIKASADSSGAVVREVEGSALFSSAAFMPGESENGVLKVSSSLSAPVYMEWRCSSGQQNHLYRQLELRISGRNGEQVYEGPLRNLNGICGPIRKGEDAVYDLTLTLPAEADSSSAGEKADFHILLTFTGNVGNSGNQGGNGGNSGGTGSGSSGSGGSGDPGSGNGDDSGGNGSSGGSGSGSSGSGGNQGGSGNPGSGSSGSGGNGTGTNTGGASGNSSGSGNSGNSGSSGSGTGTGMANGSGGSGSGNSGSSGSGSSSGGSSGGSGGSSGSSSGGSGSGSGGTGSGGTGSGSGSYSEGTDAAGIRTISSNLYQPSGVNGHGYLGGGSGAGYRGGGKEQVYPAPDPSLRTGIDSGNWVRDPSGEGNKGAAAGNGGSAGSWRYKLSSGDYLKNGFALIRNPYDTTGQSFGWFYFDGSGYMQICWIRTEQDHWYHAHEQSDGFLGMIETGWVRCEGDGKQYYLDERTAVMQSGWLGFVNSMAVCDYYYFARLEDTYKQNWFLNTAIGRWIYDRLGGRSYGSMYEDEKTPDGSIVDKNGKKIR